MKAKVMIYQMGKVGSMSVNHALKDAGVLTNFGHWIQHEWPIGEFGSKKLNLVKDIKAGSIHPLKVISLVREPVDRAMSAFFQLLHKYTDEYRQLSAKELHVMMVEKYNIHYPDQWFELELKDVFKFDALEYPFDHERGYKIYERGMHKFLIMRMEDAGAIFREAMWKFFGIPDLEMYHDNMLLERQKNTFVGEKYKEFRSLPVPEEFLNRCYALPYARHFYTEKERARFKKKWMGG